MVSFLRVGLLGFGGGPTFIPLIRQESQRHGWLDQERFVEALAFGNALPGPIATKLAGYVGYRAAGWWGTLAAVLALSVPTIVAIILLGDIYLRYQHLDYTQRFLSGVRPTVVALVAMVIVEFIPTTFGPARSWLRNGGLWLWAILSFVLLKDFHLHPAFVILSGGLLGLTLLREPR